MDDFSGKIVLITGAGKGIGRSLAEAFAARGARLALNDISPINLDDTLEHILHSGGQARAYVEDIAKKMPIQALLNNVQDDLGQIDILVNCAEVEPHKTVLEMDDWDWERTLNVNLSGPFLLTQSVARMMKARQGGVIIHVGERPSQAELRSAYLASKAGLAAFTALAACELEEFGIHVFYYQPDEGSDPVRQILELCG